MVCVVSGSDRASITLYSQIIRTLIKKNDNFRQQMIIKESPSEAKG